MNRMLSNRARIARYRVRESSPRGHLFRGRRPFMGPTPADEAVRVDEGLAKVADVFAAHQKGIDAFETLAADMARSGRRFR